MGDLSHEPSMEEILSSIKKIIADEGDKPVSVPRLRRAAPRDQVEMVAPVAATPAADDDADVLELTEAMDQAPVPPSTDLPPETTPMKSIDETILAEKSILASRSSLAQLTKPKSKPVATPSASDNAIEALVIDALRPMIKDWLDANLPRVVESMVAKEIARLRED
jgi:cell pole-organizing protein PopZ